jgi:hypothetical protein
MEVEVCRFGEVEDPEFGSCVLNFRSEISDLGSQNLETQIGNWQSAIGNIGEE